MTSRVGNAIIRGRLRPSDRAFWILLSRLVAVGRWARDRKTRNGLYVASPRLHSVLYFGVNFITAPPSLFVQ